MMKQMKISLTTLTPTEAGKELRYRDWETALHLNTSLFQAKGLSNIYQVSMVYPTKS